MTSGQTVDADLYSAEFHAWLREESELLVQRAQERAPGDLETVTAREREARRLAGEPVSEWMEAAMARRRARGRPV